MPINRFIPGQLQEEEMLAIEAIAALVPAEGKIVEVGSLLGLSSWIWAKSAHPSVKVYCIDPWERQGAGGNFAILAAKAHQTFSIGQFKENVSDCPNIIAKQGFSPRDFSDWSAPIDLYFEDAVHTDPILAENLEFWAGRMKPDGIFCGHDYHDRFPDVKRGAERLAKRYGRRLRVIKTFWYLLPDFINCDLSVVSQALASLHPWNGVTDSEHQPIGGGVQHEAHLVGDG